MSPCTSSTSWEIRRRQASTSAAVKSLPSCVPARARSAKQAQRLGQTRAQRVPGPLGPQEVLDDAVDDQAEGDADQAVAKDLWR